MTFQIGCWSFALICLTLLSPGGELRFSDPAVLVLLWAGIYFIYPTIALMKGDFNVVGNPVSLFWLQGYFILGLLSGYILFRKRSRFLADKIDLDDLPTGWFFYLFPFLGILTGIVIRLASGGRLLPEVTYTENVFAAQQVIDRTFSEGGLSYLWTQIQCKFGYYLSIMQGVGAGLIIAHTIRTKQNIWRNIIILGCGFLITLFFGDGTRSTVIMIYIIALVFVDILVRIPWRVLGILGIVVILLFDFYGRYRAHRDQAFGQAVDMAYSELYGSGKNRKFNEFKSIMVKEAVGLSIFEKRKSEGLTYIFYSFLNIIPSQLLPDKMKFQRTFHILAVVILGEEQVRAGAGAAGAMVVDGYRLAGTLGVPLLGAILGGLLALLENWLAKEALPGVQGPRLFKVSLIAGFYAWIFNVIRGDLAILLSALFYYIIIPWFVILIIINQESIWRKPGKIVLKRQEGLP